MRKFLFIPLLFTGLLRLPAQSVAQPADPFSPEDPGFDAVYQHHGVPVVEGRVVGLTATECRQLPVTYTLVTPFAEFQSKRPVTLADDGSFTLKLDYALPYQQIWLQVGDLFFGGLYADKRLRVQLDAQKLKATNGVTFYGDGVQFTGPDAPLNVYLAEYLTRRSPDQQRLTMSRQMLVMRAGKNPDSILPAFRRMTDSLEAIDDSYVAAHPSPYSRILRNENQSGTYAELLTAYWYKRMPDSIWKHVNQHKAWCISNDGMQFYNYLAMYSPKADWLKMRLGSAVELDSQQTTLHRIAPTLHTPWCRKVVDEESERTDRNISAINAALAASKVSGDSVAFGRPLFKADFGATLYKLDHESAAGLLGRMAQAFPGKAIIIDRWATWCGPCIADMPHSKQLQSDAAGLPVVFVYLCTKQGSSEEKWKLSVFNMRQPGVHIFIDEKLDAEISSYFSFGGYPGYALIGKDGKYKPGALRDLSQIEDRKALEALVAR